MSTGVRQSARASGNRNDDFWEWELQRRPEVRIVNNYAIGMAYIRIGRKAIGALALLWATVVLLGGFVSNLDENNFRTVTIIAFFQAAGLADGMAGDNRLMFFITWVLSLVGNTKSLEKHLHERARLPMREWLKRQLRKTTFITVAFIISPVTYFAFSGPMLCFAVAMGKVPAQNYNRQGDATNLYPALNIFYYLTAFHGAMCILSTFTEVVADALLLKIVSKRHGFSKEVLTRYLYETKKMRGNNPAASMDSWNLITYGAGLLDSQLPEDYAFGGSVLIMLIDKDIPAPITWLLIRSPRQRIHKLIGTLEWRSPADREMRWIAARIVEHLASHLNLAQFPGALECISSMFDTCHTNDDQEALHLPFVIGRSTPGRRNIFKAKIRQSAEHDIKQKIKEDEEIGEDLILTGLRILENLAHDKHNCTLIYNTKDLLSKIAAPVCSDSVNFVKDIMSNAGWTKVVAGSLKVVSRLMSSPGSTGEEMRSLIADDGNAVKNLDTVLDEDIIELQMPAIEILTQLVLHHPASSTPERRVKVIKKALRIFVTTVWMESYLKEERRKIDKSTTSQQLKAQEAACRLKEKAGEALAMLSSDSEVTKSVTWSEDDVNCITELLNSKIEINTGCRISAAAILKNLRKHGTEVKEPALRKVLQELLPIQAEVISISRCWECVTSCIKNDIENPSNGGQGEPFARRSHIQQCRERRLQAELLSLVAAVRPSDNANFLAILISQPQPVALEDFVLRLKKMVEDNMYATPACLAIQKLTCKMVIKFIPDDRNAEVIDKHDIVGTLLEASKRMSSLESSMLFAGVDQDCHGVPLRPLSSDLAKEAEDDLTQRKQVLAINIAASVGIP